VIGRFQSILFVSVFQGSLAVGSEKPNRQLGFELQSSHVLENRNNKQQLCATNYFSSEKGKTFLRC